MSTGVCLLLLTLGGCSVLAQFVSPPTPYRGYPYGRPYWNYLEHRYRPQNSGVHDVVFTTPKPELPLGLPTKLGVLMMRPWQSLPPLFSFTTSTTAAPLHHTTTKVPVYSYETAEHSEHDEKPHHPEHHHPELHKPESHYPEKPQSHLQDQHKPQSAYPVAHHSQSHHSEQHKPPTEKPTLHYEVVECEYPPQYTQHHQTWPHHNGAQPSTSMSLTPVHFENHQRPAIHPVKPQQEVHTVYKPVRPSLYPALPGTQHVQKPVTQKPMHVPEQHYNNKPTHVPEQHLQQKPQVPEQHYNNKPTHVPEQHVQQKPHVPEQHYNNKPTHVPEHHIQQKPHVPEQHYNNKPTHDAEHNEHQVPEEQYNNKPEQTYAPQKPAPEYNEYYAQQKPEPYVPQQPDYVPNSYQERPGYTQNGYPAIPTDQHYQLTSQPSFGAPSSFEGLLHTLHNLQAQQQHPELEYAHTLGKSASTEAPVETTTSSELLENEKGISATEAASEAETETEEIVPEEMKSANAEPISVDEDTVLEDAEVEAQ